MSKITNQNGFIKSKTIDNQRIAKEINGTIYQKYLWLDNTTLLGFYDKDNNFARFTYAIDRTPLKMEYKGATHYLIYDRLGSLRAVSGSNGQRFIKQIDYDSFGNVIRDDNYDTTGKLTDNPILDLDIPLGFAGGLYDKDTGLTRFGFRDYDPNTGRWTAKDPIDFNGEQSNLYVYVGNDPINYVDPDGKYLQYVAGGIVAIMAGKEIVEFYNKVEGPVAGEELPPLRDMTGQEKMNAYYRHRNDFRNTCSAISDLGSGLSGTMPLLGIPMAPVPSMITSTVDAVSH